MRLLITLFVVISSQTLIAQKHKPIDQVGWEMPEISMPENLSPADSGTVNYLLKIDKSGKIKDVKIISNSFNEEVESGFRNQLKDITLTKKKSDQGSTSYKGTFEISLKQCASDECQVQFELTGRLINSPVSPDCGIIAWAVVAEFETNDLPLKESKLYKSLPVIIGCPELYGKDFFQSGKTYKMVVTTKKETDYAISNESVLNNYMLDNRFWLISIKKVD